MSASSVIYKRQLQYNLGPQVLDLEEGAQILCVKMQAGHPTVWYRTTAAEDIPRVARIMHVVGTGLDFPSAFTYLGTVWDSSPAGDFVWHVLEEQKDPA